jgi:predicted RecA/RadA family phage recombinase
MPLATFIHDGDAIDHTPTSDVASGDVVVQGDLVAIAKQPIAANTLGALAVMGVFDFPKPIAGGSAVAVGTKVYWDAASQLARLVEAGNTYLGKAVRAAGDGDAIVRVRLDQ